MAHRSDVFTKSSPRAPVGFYEVEAAGLAWLAAAGPGAAHVVGVRSVGEDFITLERLTPTSPTSTAAAALGAALALTHAAGAQQFGQPPAGWSGVGYIGQQVMSLQPEPAWGHFYAEQRLLPYATKAREIGNLSRDGMTAVERVCQRLVSGDWDDGGHPARIHGDLWSGNVIFTGAGVVLIDPAAHGGHALTDLAMLHLFGAPHLATITASYAEAAQLPRDWEELIALHQLHPLLVHAVTHGPSYGEAAARSARLYA